MIKQFLMRLKHNKAFGISKDFLWNLLASMVATCALQLVVYPILAKHLSLNNYGSLLTIIGIANIIATACGNSLNNTRLILDREYQKIQKNGDFSLIFWGMAVIICLGFGGYCICDKFTLSRLLVLLFTLFCFGRSYLSVEYRLVINFKKIFLSNLYVALGNMVGLLLFIFNGVTNLWPLPFLLGEFAGFMYVTMTTKVIQEPVSYTELFRRTFGKEMILLVTALSANALIYLDRLLILPLLGGTAVTTYSVASVVGKSLGVLMTPLTGVLLSYYVQKGFAMNRKVFWKINVLTMTMAGFFLAGCMLICRWATGILYPTVIGQAEAYLVIANLTAIVNIVGNVTQTSVLAFTPTIWQLIIQMVYCSVYLLAGVLGAKTFGLWGFSFGALLAAGVKLILLYAIGHIFIEE